MSSIIKYLKNRSSSNTKLNNKKLLELIDNSNSRINIADATYVKQAPELDIDLKNQVIKRKNSSEIMEDISPSVLEKIAIGASVPQRIVTAKLASENPALGAVLKSNTNIGNRNPYEYALSKDGSDMTTSSFLNKDTGRFTKFAVDLLTDPLTYLGVGAAAKGVKVASDLSKGLSLTNRAINIVKEAGKQFVELTTGINPSKVLSPLAKGYGKVQGEINNIEQSLGNKFVDWYLKKNGLKQTDYSAPYLDNLGKLKLTGSEQKKIDWATQDVIDKYKDPKNVKKLYNSLKRFSESRAFYKGPTPDMSAMELAKLTKELIKRDNLVVRGVSVDRSAVQRVLRNEKDPEVINRLNKILNETYGKPFSKESISKEDYEFLGDYFLTRIPIARKPGAGRADQYSNIKLDQNFDSAYFSNSIGESFAYTYPGQKVDDGIKIIGSVDISPKGIDEISDPIELLKNANLRNRIRDNTRKNYIITRELKGKYDLDFKGIGTSSITKGNHSLDDNYMALRLSEGKPFVYDGATSRSLQRGISSYLGSSKIAVYLNGKLPTTREIKPLSKKMYEKVDGKISETESSQELKRLMYTYKNSKSKIRKNHALKKIHSLLKDHNFIQYSYETDVLPEINFDLSTDVNEVIKSPKRIKREININEILLKPFQQEASFDPARANHYLVSGRKGDKIGALEEIYDYDKLFEKHKNKKRNHKNSIDSKDGLTTAGITGLGYLIKNKNEKK